MLSEQWTHASGRHKTLAGHYEVGDGLQRVGRPAASISFHLASLQLRESPHHNIFLGKGKAFAAIWTVRIYIMGNSANGRLEPCQQIVRCLSFLKQPTKGYNRKRIAVPRLSLVAENPLAQKRMKSQKLPMSEDSEMSRNERLFTFHPDTTED